MASPLASMMKSSSLLLLLCILAMHVASTHATPATHDVKKYSYICLEAEQNLCLGISPGETEPVYNTSFIYYNQLKRRLNNENSGLDYKKTRWDMNYQTSTVSLSRFSNLCMSKEPGNYDPLGTVNDKLALYPCNQTVNNAFAQFDLQAFQSNINGASELRVVGTEYCVTAMKCNPDRGGNCRPGASTVQTDKFEPGAYLKLRYCHWKGQAYRSYRNAQTFRQHLDCAVGCSPQLQFNDVCDMACANAECDLDNGMCVTASPTPPTLSPTRSPTVAPSKAPITTAPSRAPITARPTVAPTTSRPTKSPTEAPSRAPTITAGPTRAPSTSAPSMRPTGVPSESPTAKPTTRSPTAAPTTKPTDAPVAVLQVVQIEDNTALVVGIVVPLLLLLLLLLLIVFVVRERRRQRREAMLRDPKYWKSAIGSNREAYRELLLTSSAGGCCVRWGCCKKPLPQPPSSPSAFTTGSAAVLAAPPADKHAPPTYLVRGRANQPTSFNQSPVRDLEANARLPSPSRRPKLTGV